MPDNAVGLFIASYIVKNDLAGGHVLHLRLAVSTPDRTITGIGTVTQAIRDPQPFATSLFGTFEPLGLLPPAPTNILVTLDGLPVGTPPTSGIAETAHLRMLLDDTWSAGVATFRWFQDGRWLALENATVALVTPVPVTEAPAVIDLTTTKGKSKAKAGSKR